MLVGVSLAVLVGMWLERILIIWNTLSQTILPSTRHQFFPTIVDWLLLFAPLGFFALLFLLFLRLLPAIPMHEIRRLRHEDAQYEEAQP